jgi:hypothetical protein
MRTGGEITRAPRRPGPARPPAPMGSVALRLVPGKHRKPFAAAAASACLMLVGVASGPAAAGEDVVRRAPPTSAQIERATLEFLDRSGTVETKASGDGGGTGGPGFGTLFPDKRVVAFYGAPQLSATILGRKSVRGAKRKLRKQAKAYKGRGRPVIPGFDLVAVIASSDPGSDGKYRTRQPGRVIKKYLAAARDVDGRLLLDIQPGRSHFIDEVKAMRKWLRKRNVDVALDPEWNVGRHGVPGRDRGSVSAKQLNAVSSYLNRLVRRRGLPPKLMVVHQFRQGSIHHRDAIKRRDEVDVTLNYDGIGSRQAKTDGYESLSRPKLFNGFSLFYSLDKDLMRPGQVIRLDPTPDYVLYQ